MRIQIVLSFFIVLLFTACEYSDGTLQYDLGNDFIDDPARVILIDTFTVNSYTSISDTFYTSRAKRFLSGIVSTDFGIETYCENYFCIEAPEAVSFEESAAYDSVAFILNLDGYRYGDTSKVSEFEIYRVTDSIVLNSETDYIYNNKRFAVEDKPLGRFSVDLSKVNPDSIHVRLPDELGKELYDLCLNDTDSILENDAFNSFFRGISIRPVKEKSGFIVGIQATPDSITAPRIRVYYHDASLEDDLSFDFPLEVSRYSSSSDIVNVYSTNYIMNTYKGIELSKLKTTEDRLASGITGNLNFLQSGISLYARYEIPTVDDIYYLGIGSIIKAELLLSPLRSTFNEEKDLPSSLLMNLVDSRNRYYQPLYQVGSTTTTAKGELKFNRDFKEDTYYSYDVSTYLKDEYFSKAQPEYSLMMYLPYDPVYPTVDLLVLGNQKNTNNPLKLKVYLATY
jgi:hypothetical protein